LITKNANIHALVALCITGK